MAENQIAPIRAQAQMHHAYLLGLQLMIATRKGDKVMEDWMFALFRRQHLEKFLSSFNKLGLSGLPDAVACAKYHVLSNAVGGVAVEFMAESDKKAWVRFRYPRWMYHGAAICGVPVGVSRGFLKGWYAHNGISLNNPRLGYVCVSEDMTGEFGFCGYFKEYDHDLNDDERLQFARGELPPVYKAAEQPQLPVGDWSPIRLEKAKRNYALDYIRNGLRSLSEVIGIEDTIALGRLAARLIGLQYYAESAAILGAIDGDTSDAANYLRHIMTGMGDQVSQLTRTPDGSVSFDQTGLRVIRGLDSAEGDVLLQCWQALWSGTIQSHRQMMTLRMNRPARDRLTWTIQQRKYQR